MKLLCLKCLKLKLKWQIIQTEKLKTPPPRWVSRQWPQTSQAEGLTDPFSAAGLQATTKHSGFPVRMDNAVPIAPQAPAAQPLQIPSGVLAQVRAGAGTRVAKARLRIGCFAFALSVRSWP